MDNNIYSKKLQSDIYPIINDKIDLLSLSEEEICDIIKIRFDMPSYRARQIFRWLYRNTDEFSKMTDISKNQQSSLEEIFLINKIKEVKKQVSKTDGTEKYLFELYDKNIIESVLMKYKHGNSACISTQAGCRMNCLFCASAIGGFRRNLLPSEMLLQIMYINKNLPQGEHISNIVLMGIGEPLDNFENVIKFLDLVNAKNGLNIGYRHISLSTSGLCDKINELAGYKYPITLSISIHASNDAVRDKIMPVNKKWNLSALIGACKKYLEQTGRRISFEYILINDFNDRPEDATELARMINDMLCHVNLIPLNNVLEKNLLPSDEKKVKKFCEILLSKGINATIRRKCGNDIDASCGQLRLNNLNVNLSANGKTNIGDDLFDGDQRKN